MNAFGTISYQYDANGNVIRITDRDGLVTTYAYNRLNEKVQEQWHDGGRVVRTLNYAYDAAGNLTSTSDPSASYTYAYDSLNRPTSVTTKLPGLYPTVTLRSQYDNSGNRTQLSATIGTTAEWLAPPIPRSFMYVWSPVALQTFDKLLHLAKFVLRRYREHQGSNV